MVALAAPDRSTISVRSGRRVWLIWQEPDSRRLIKVGQLDERPNGGFTFKYLPSARNEEGFVPLAQFPDVDQVYETTGLPAFFANRVMSPRRENYDDYVSWLGLDAPAEPVEVLVRTGGGRATDTFHVVDDLTIGDAETVTSMFFASGVRHVQGAMDRVSTLVTGQELRIRDEPRNPANERAMLLDAARDVPVGYIPDWLVDDVHALRDAGLAVRVLVERVNLDAPNHLKLLCRLEAEPVSRT